MSSILQKLFDKSISMKICYACTRNLDKQSKRASITTEVQLVECKCGKQYEYDRLHRRYSKYIPPRENKFFA